MGCFRIAKSTRRSTLQHSRSSALLLISLRIHPMSWAYDPASKGLFKGLEDDHRVVANCSVDMCAHVGSLRSLNILGDADRFHASNYLRSC